MKRDNKYSSIYMEFTPYAQFAEDLISRFNWAPKVKRELEDEMAGLKSKMGDRCVNIATAGDFTSGKSSLINAMLGMELLKVDELPDTTLVPSVIEYSNILFLRICYRRGPDEIHEGISLEDIRELLSEYSYTESTELNEEHMMERRASLECKAAKIKYIRIGLPSAFLKKGFRLIDTPGLNSLNVNSEMSANEAFVHSDAFLIVIDATRAFTQSFRKKVSAFIGNRIAMCPFVITHFDQVPRKSKTLIAFKTAVSIYFGLNPGNSLVAPMVPPTILAQIKGKTFGSDHEQMLRLSLDSLRNIEEFAIKKRESAIAETLRKKLERMLADLKKHILEIQADYREKLSKLERSRSSPLEPFLKKELEEALVVIDDEAKRYRVTMEGKLASIISETKADLEMKLCARPNLNALHIYVKEDVPKFLAETADKMKSCGTAGNLHVAEVIKKRQRLIDKNLAKEFERLKIMPIQFKKISIEGVVNTNDFQNYLKGVLEFSASEANREDDSDALEVIGFIAGAVAAIALPGIGISAAALLLGGRGIGKLLGARGRSTKASDTVKLMKSKYETELDRVLTAQSSNVLNAYDQKVSEYVANLKSSILEFQAQYKIQISEIIKNEISLIEKDLDGITKKQNEINSKWKIK